MFIGGLTVEVLGCYMRDPSHSSSSYIENFANRIDDHECQIQHNRATCASNCARGSRDGNKHLNVR